MKLLKIIIIVTLSTTLGFFGAIAMAQKSILSSKSKYNDNFLEEVMEKIRNDYVDKKTSDQLYEAAASGILNSLDPHSSFLNTEDLKEMTVHTKGEFGGVGIEITTENTIAKVVSAIEDTPAYRAGIKSGDFIIRIDGKSTYSMKIDEVVKKIRGRVNSPVKLTIYRKGEKEPLEKILVRKVIKIKPVKAQKFNDVAYIKITNFSEKTSKNLHKELNKLKSQIGIDKLKGLVLDLRNNPGGLLDQAIEVTASFLDKGKSVVSIKGRTGVIKEFQTDQNQFLIPNLPIVILINEGSASASEIVAGALQDHKRAIIMGTKSFGKGSVQTVMPLDRNQGAIKMTTALYYTPSGRSIQAKGIEPDIELTSASIEKEKNLERESEADLKGHIEIKLQEAIEKSDTKPTTKKISDDNIEVYQKDYQLARALDLIRGVSLYNSISNK